MKKVSRKVPAAIFLSILVILCACVRKWLIGSIFDYVAGWLIFAVIFFCLAATLWASGIFFGKKNFAKRRD